MKIVMDSDCLVKLTKAGIKEAVIGAMEVHIPSLVKKETVDEAKARGYQDAFVIEENISRNCLHVSGSQRNAAHFNIPVSKGESEVVSLYAQGGFDAVASDDRRFLKKLESANVPYLTPAACVLYLYRGGKADKVESLRLIENLKPHISNEEYLIARFYLEDRS